MTFLLGAARLVAFLILGGTSLAFGLLELAMSFDAIVVDTANRHFSAITVVESMFIGLLGLVAFCAGLGFLAVAFNLPVFGFNRRSR